MSAVVVVAGPPRRGSCKRHVDARLKEDVQREVWTVPSCKLSRMSTAGVAVTTTTTVSHVTDDTTPSQVSSAYFIRRVSDAPVENQMEGVPCDERGNSPTQSVQHGRRIRSIL